MRSVYLDNNATTAVAPEVHEALEPYFLQEYGNPSSLHTQGVVAERAISDARHSIANRLGVQARDLIFTSGATESDNLALRGIAKANPRGGTHIVTSTIEHEAVLDTVMELTEMGYTASFVQPDAGGRIQPDAVARQVSDETIMVAVMHVNNELGTINPVADIAAAVKQQNTETYVIVDGAQALGKMPIDLTDIDCYAASGHKFHAPKGVGLLYVREGTKIKPIQTGGGQERSLRSGTENVPGIVALERAVSLGYDHLEQYRERMRVLNARLREGIASVPEAVITSPDDALENTVNAAFPGVPAEVLLNALDERGISVSTGSACSSNKQRESHVLKALQLPERVRQSTLRFGLSRYTSEEDIEYTVAVLQEIVPQLRVDVTQ